MQLAYIDNTLQRVKEVLNVWAECSKVDKDKQALGYAANTVFLSGGGVWGNWVEDNQASGDHALAEAVDAIMEDMPGNQTDAIFHFHVAAVIKPRRTNIEDDYADALISIEIGLRKRNKL